MRWAVASLVGCVLLAGAAGQDAKEKTAGKRYGVEADAKAYPQGTPQETLASVLKAIADKRIDYLLAQLAEPRWVDKRVKENAGGFAALVEESRERLADDPGAAKRLAKFLKDGEWKIDEAAASVRLKDVDDQGVFFRKAGERWFLENRKK
jgi:hypothetical protein